MERDDIVLRNTTYAMFVEFGRAPTAADVADRLERDREGVVDGWRRLHDAHALVLDRDTDQIRMANPFSAVPTGYRVQAGGKSWFANCAWDAFGIFAALDVDGSFDASCPDCGDEIALQVVDRQPSDASLLFHCLVPASRWWNDIVFT